LKFTLSTETGDGYYRYWVEGMPNMPKIVTGMCASEEECFQAYYEMKEQSHASNS